MIRFWVGAACFLVGGGLWLLARRQEHASQASGAPPTARVLPPLLPRFGLALGALGAAAMSSTRPELSWTISTICFAAVSIVLFITILVEQLRGRA